MTFSPSLQEKYSFREVLVPVSSQDTPANTQSRCCVFPFQLIFPSQVEIRRQSSSCHPWLSLVLQPAELLVFSQAALKPQHWAQGACTLIVAFLLHEGSIQEIFSYVFPVFAWWLMFFFKLKSFFWEKGSVYACLHYTQHMSVCF